MIKGMSLCRVRAARPWSSGTSVLKEKVEAEELMGKQGRIRANQTRAVSQTSRGEEDMIKSVERSREV